MNTEKESKLSKDENLKEDISLVDKLTQAISEKLNIGSGPDNVEQLNKQKLQNIIDLLANEECTKVITIAGAGISTSAGIPDFRSKGSGLYFKLEKYNLPYPTAIFELDYLRQNPKAFFTLAKELYPINKKPTISHKFIKLLEKRGKLLRHYTQNIDMLEKVCGISDEKLVEAHGHFRTGHCIDCQREYPEDFMRKEVFRDQIPRCLKCKGIVKPDIVFFGESLPERFLKCVQDDFQQCELLIILGSSLTVEPFASLVTLVNSDVPRLLINRETVQFPKSLFDLMRSDRAVDFESKSEKCKDAVLLGDCDSGCRFLIEKLNWDNDLELL